ncbi:MAG: hypothetical protein ACJ76F_07645 [Bacteroidia bacterium]
MMNYSMHYCMMAPRLQLIFASAVLSACGTLAEQGFRRAAQGNIMPGYRGFYNDLSAVNERAFVRIVHTKEYASLMQETMRFLSEIKRSGDGNGSGPGASGNPLRKI